MTFRTLTVTSHPSTTFPVPVPDMGFDAPAAAATPIVVTDPNELDDAANSDSLRALATDAAFGSGFGSISLDDGGNIPPILVSARLDALSRFEEDWVVIATGPGTGLHETTVVTAGGDAVVAIGP
jgi:hypothetical protein